jgi:hypothetical protein
LTQLRQLHPHPACGLFNSKTYIQDAWVIVSQINTGKAWVALMTNHLDQSIIIIIIDAGNYISTNIITKLS